MNHSIRDIGILTAYSALMLSRNQTLNLMVIVASGAAFLLLSFIFGLSSIKKLFRLRVRQEGRRSFVPLAIIFLVWCLVFTMTPWCPILPFRPRLAELALSVGAAMLCGLLAATIPLMFNLDSRKMDLNDQTLWVGYWTLCAGMSSSGLTACVIMLTNRDTVSELDIIRLPSVIGMIASVLATWYLIGCLRRGKDSEPSVAR